MYTASSPLDAARGIVNGVLLGLVFWGAFGAVVYLYSLVNGG